MNHPLQKAWADEAVEKDYFRRIEAMIHSGDLDAAAEVLLADLALLDSPLAEMCRNLSEDAVDIAGWEEIGDAIAQYEGDPITAVHIVMSNEADLVFEDKDRTHQPDIEVVFYTDEHLPFSTLGREELLNESLRGEEAEWFGRSEDMEVYLEINGLGPLNTALLRHKRQYYFRDQMHVLDEVNGLEADTAPWLYVEFCLAALLRAVRYHQAVKALVEGYGLRGNLPVIVGMHNMRFNLGSVYMARSAKVVEIAKTAKLAVTIKRNMEEIPEEVSGSALRQRVQIEDEVPKPGFLRRLFGRR
ncbi:MAG: hypothetical protein ACRCY3_11635 [Sphingorhabdus sp.]